MTKVETTIVRPRSSPWPADLPATSLVNIGCGPFYANGWTNVDVVHEPDHGINPDVVLTSIDRLPFPSSSVTAIYLGHVLEHIRWDDRLLPYLTELLRVLIPGGEVCVVGPDVNRAIAMWKRGNLDWFWLDATLEGAVAGPDDHPWDWDGCRHQWNCTEERVVLALGRAGFVDVQGVPMESARLDPYPVVSRVSWQCAALARKAVEAVERGGGG